MPWLVVIHQPRHFPRDPPATCPAPKRGTKYGAALWSPNHRGFPVICWKPHAGVSSIGCKLEQFAPVLQPKGDTSSPFARVRLPLTFVKPFVHKVRPLLPPVRSLAFRDLPFVSLQVVWLAPRCCDSAPVSSRPYWPKGKLRAFNARCTYLVPFRSPSGDLT
jgi:hypothetical protein